MSARHGARNVRVFGSTVRGDAGPQSDIDLLVDVEAGRTLLDLIAFEQDLEDVLGCSVQALTDGGLSPYLQQRILRMRQDATLRKLEVIGQAVKKLSEQTKSSQPDMPWKQIAGMRDKIIHDHFGVNLEIVWRVVQLVSGVETRLTS